MKESYQTRQGALILQTMQNLAGPVTAEALCAILREQRVSKATVYRHLERLTAAGQLRRFSPAEGAAACYQRIIIHIDKTFFLSCCISVSFFKINKLSGIANLLFSSPLTILYLIDKPRCLFPAAHIVESKSFTHQFYYALATNLPQYRVYGLVALRIKSGIYLGHFHMGNSHPIA